MDRRSFFGRLSKATAGAVLAAHLSLGQIVPIWASVKTHKSYIYDVHGQTVFPMIDPGGGIRCSAVAYLIEERGPNDYWAQAVVFDDHKLFSRGAQITEEMIRYKATEQWQRVDVDGGRLPDALPI
jgi:hypothetical protein